MSALIKSGNHSAGLPVRPFSLASQAPPISKTDEQRLEFERRIEALERSLRERDVAIEGMREDIGRAYKEGEERGRASGLSEAQDRQAERLSILESAARTAQMELSAKLGSLERLAALLARDCLDMILGNPAYQGELIHDILHSQLAKIDRAMLVAIEVSSDDFTDAEALAHLAANVGLSPAMLKSDEKMPNGACRMTLRLGTMEVGVHQQWGVLRNLLDQIVHDGATP